MLKESQNPPIIFPEEKSITDFEGPWRVAHTKSRNEKALAWQMTKKNVPYFLPMTWKVSTRKRRTYRSLLPVFTGYIFFCGNEENRLEVLKTNRVANIIEVIDQARLLADLAPIEKAIRRQQPLLPHKYIKKGQLCRVIAGPLMGTEGIVVTTPRHTRLVLQVEMLGQATSVEIDMDMIELIK
jgi:transcription antitermination factor NusG